MSRQTLLPILAFLAATVSLLVPLPAGSILFDEVQNSGHSILFGILALVALYRLGAVGGATRVRGFKHYLLAFGLTLCFGILTEVAQNFTGRDGNPYDVLMDTVGILAFLAFYWTIDSSQIEYSTRVGKSGRMAIRLISVLLVATAFVPLTTWSLAYLTRNHQFPLICDFSSRLSSKFAIPQESVMEIVTPPVKWADAPSKVGKVTFSTGEYPGVRIDEPYPDWRGFSEFYFSIYSDNPDTIRFALRIDDSHHNYQLADRFNDHLLVLPGVNRYAFSLEKVKLGPVHRETDMAHIASFTIFTSPPSKPFVLYFGQIGLR